MNEGKKTYEASAAIEPYRVLQLTSGKVLHNIADADGVVVGFSEYPAAAGDYIAVMMINLPGTREVMASGAIDEGAKCYAAAAGMVSALPVAAGTYRQIGVAMEAAADGEVFEIMPTPSTETAVVAG
jgi:hypothetical protein